MDSSWISNFDFYDLLLLETRPWLVLHSIDPFFQNFFGDLARSRPQVQNSLGSGVILSKDGYVVSNYHVVGQATDIRVVLNDRREFSAEVVLGDEVTLDENEE